jgi:hypothetical protein
MPRKAERPLSRARLGVLPLVLSFAACAGVHRVNDAVRTTVERTLAPRTVQYTLALRDVERPPTAVARGGPSTISALTLDAANRTPGELTTQGVYAESNGDVATADGAAAEESASTHAARGITPYVFSDSAVVVALYPTATAIHFTVANRTDRSMRILWDRALFVDALGRSGTVTHAGAGADFGDRTVTQPATIVLRRAMVSDAVVPSENVELVHMGDGRQARIRPMLPSPDCALEELPRVVAKLRADLVGRSIAFLLPLEVDSERADYLFTFVITDVSEAGGR